MPAARDSRWIEVACALAIAAAAAAIFWQQQALGRLGRERDGLPPAGLRAKWLATQARVERLDRQLASSSPAAAGLPAPGRISTETNRPLQLRVDAARSRESILIAYGPLIKALGLDPATSERFENLLAQERLTARDALVAAQAQGIPSLQGYKAAVEEAISHDDEQIGALLNPAGFAQFDAYRQTLPEQETVATLAERLSGTPAPLTDDQQAQLVQLIDRMEPAAYLQNQAFLAVIGMDSAPLTPAMVSAAPSLLSPPQAGALQEMEAAWQAKAQLQQALRVRAPRAIVP
jgi:hypothetical protein